MTRHALCAATLLLSVLLLPARANAQATSSGMAVNHSHFGTVHDVVINDTDQTEKWFKFYARVAGRSYCVEVGSSPTASSTPFNGWNGDPYVQVFRSDATTLILGNDNAEDEPDGFYGSRACFLSPQTGVFYVRVADYVSGEHTYRMRVVETTLWASWFFIGGDYNSFVLLRNTTDKPVTYTITWRNPAGLEIGTTSSIVGAHAAVGINARTFVSNPAVNFNGTVEIAHRGSPQALVGQVTSLSATTGLGYDATLFQRQPW